MCNCICIFICLYIPPLWMWWGVTPYHMRGGRERDHMYLCMYMQCRALQYNAMGWHGMVGYGMHVFYVMDVILCYVLINIHTHTYIYIRICM
jgi:hypothetical protein